MRDHADIDHVHGGTTGKLSNTENLLLTLFLVHKEWTHGHHSSLILHFSALKAGLDRSKS